MNIKKKISFFALFLISSFFIVSEVKGSSYSCTGNVCYGSSIASEPAKTNFTPDATATWDSDGIYAYRITLVNKKGETIVGPKNIIFNNKLYMGNYFYNTQKFSSNFDYRYPSSSLFSHVTSSIYKKDDTEYVNYIDDQFKNYYLYSRDSDKFISSMGFKAKIDEYKQSNNQLFAIVEKIYTVSFSSTFVSKTGEIVYADMCKDDSLKKIYEKTTGIYPTCTNHDLQYGGTTTAIIKYELKKGNTNSYTGTGSEIAKLLEQLNMGKKVPNTSYTMTTSELNNLIYKYYDGGSLKLFGKGVKVDMSKNPKPTTYGFGPLSNTPFPDSCEKNPDNLNCIYNPSYGYAYGLIKVKSSSGCNSKADADSMGLDWNASNSTCCAAGTKYNPKRKACETVETECTKNNHISLGRSYNTTLKKCCLPGQNLSESGKARVVTSCFTKDSAPTNYDYNYYCYTQSNMCSKNKVNSTINSYVTTVKNGPTSMYTKGPTQSNLTDNQSGECILNNSAYYVGTVNGTKIYCSDSLETSLSGMISNLSVKSGTFMPVSSPTITVNHNCYFTLANHSAKEPYTKNIKDIYSEFTSPSINLNFMNKDYTFNGSSSSVDTGTLSAQSKETAYGAKYYTYSFKTTYTPGYSSSLLNKFVDKKTATGSGDSFAPINGMAYNQMSKNINISIPTDASGTYSAKYTLGSNSYSNPAINKILSNSTTTLKKSYDTKKTVECGGTCKIEYSSKFLNCTSTGSLIRDIFKNGYGSDLNISNTKDLCQFTMQFPVGSKAECTRAKGTLKTLTATYTKDSCTQKVVFNTSVTGADSSCSNSVTVENIDIKEDLVFRPISLSNPFPGQNGKGRSMGSPWTDDLKKTYITNRSDVYSKKPLYSITLTPSSIKQIRDYNKKNSYDDFNLICSNGEACYSIFLRNYSKIVNTNKSNCYNPNDRSVNAFNSCADYSKRT